MQWVGITGVMGAGKTTVSKMIENSGFPVVYADQVARAVVAKGTMGLAEVVQVFGPGVLHPDQSLNREALGRLVFGNQERLKRLESILHPKIQSAVLEFRNQHRQNGETVVFYDVPLLFEKGLQSQYDSIICVVAEEQKVLLRLKNREKWRDEEIKSRLRHQFSQDEKIAGSQYVIDNNGTLQELELKVEATINSLLKDPKKNPLKK